MKRILPDCRSEAYVLSRGRDGEWHMVNRSGVSRAGSSPGAARYADEPYAALAFDALQRMIRSPERVFVPVLHENMHRYGFEVR